MWRPPPMASCRMLQRPHPQGRHRKAEPLGATPTKLSLGFSSTTCPPASSLSWLLWAHPSYFPVYTPGTRLASNAGRSYFLAPAWGTILEGVQRGPRESPTPWVPGLGGPLARPWAPRHQTRMEASCPRGPSQGTFIQTRATCSPQPPAHSQGAVQGRPGSPYTNLVVSGRAGEASLWTHPFSPRHCATFLNTGHPVARVASPHPQIC